MKQELPDGTVTVMFTDMVGSTALTNRLGDEPARALMRDVEAIVTSQVERHRGVEVKGLGDGQMVAFTSARRAVLCGIDVQRTLSKWRDGDAARSALTMRIGLHTGEVLREESDLFGATVNFAARVAAHGGADDVVVSGITWSLVGALADVRVDELGEVELKGFPGAWKLLAVRWEEQREEPLAGGEIPYIGRQSERAALRRALLRAQKGAGSIALIAGEPGIGKTRLARELMGEARTVGCFTVLGHCYDMEVTAPFLPFQEALDYVARVVEPGALRTALGPVGAEIARIAPRLRQIFPDLGAPADLPPEQARHYLFTCVGDYLQNATAMQPTVLVLDDLQWADESTSLLIEHVAGRIEEMALLVIGTYRDSELDPGKPFARALDRLTRMSNVERISLRRLPAEGVRAMLGAIGGREPPDSLVELITGETEGVPLFVQELFRYLKEEGRLFTPEGAWRTDVTVDEVEVPEGVRLVISRRVERVSADARRVLTLASVIGRGFSFELLAKLADLGEDAILDALDESEGAHLLVSATGREARYRFSHEQVRQTLLGTLSVARRQRLHQRVADALEDASPEEIEERAPELAYHLYHAGTGADAARTLRYTEMAGDRARRAGAFAEAVAHYRRALTLAQSDAARSSILFRLALAVRATSGNEAAVEVFREGTEAAQRAGLTDQLWRSQIEMARSQLQLNWFEESYETASSALQNELPPRARAILLVIKAAVGAHAGRDAQACESDFREGLALLGDPIGSFSFGLTYACEWYSPAKAAELLPSVDVFRKLAPPANLHEGLRYAAHASVVLGNMEQGLALAHEAAQVAERHGDRFGEGIARTFVADITLIREGDLAAYAAMADQRRDWLSHSLPAWSYTKWHPEWLTGEWERMRAGLMEERRTGLPLARRFALATLGRLLVSMAPRPELDDVLDEIQRFPLPAPGGPLHYTMATWLMHAVEAMGIAARPWDWKCARGLVEQLIEVGVVTDTAVDDIALWRKTAGIAAACMDDWPGAEAHFAVAIEQADRLPHRIEQADVRRWYGWALLKRGEASGRDAAVALLEESLRRYEAIGMAGHAGIARDLLQRARAAGG